MDVALKAMTAMAPVIILLGVLDRFDVFNLIRMRVIALLLGAGVVAAGVSLLANGGVLSGFPIPIDAYSRYGAPIVEETLKALPIVVLFAMNRLGFKLDAAIAGFAVGAGFSVAENLWYLRQFADANYSAWLVRGFGTAVMHGGATALFAVIGHEFSERQAQAKAQAYRFNPLRFAPGLLLAIAIHSLFNHFPGQPVATMALTLLLAPSVLFLTFARSDHVTQQWLRADAEAHRKALEDIRAGHFAESDAGKAIHAQLARIQSAHAEDVFAYAELKTELVLRAEELILASQQGAGAALSDIDRAKCARLDALEAKLGWPVLTAIAPHLGFSRNDLWELEQLRGRARDVA